MESVDVVESLLNLHTSFPLDFLFNNNFIKNVDMQIFDYKPYMASFVLGFFTFIQCSAPAQKNFSAYHIDGIYRWVHNSSQSKWLILTERRLHFLNFYFVDNPKHIASDSILPEYVHNDVVKKMPDSNKPSSGNWSHYYMVYPINDSQNGMKIIMRKMPSRRTLFDKNSTGNVNYSLFELDSCKNFSMFNEKAPLSLDSRLYVLGTLNDHSNKSLLNSNNNPSTMCGFVHGFLFIKYFKYVFVEHGNYEGMDSFFLKILTPAEELGHVHHALSLNSKAQVPNRLEKISHYLLMPHEDAIWVGTHGWGSECSSHWYQSLEKNGFNYFKDLLEYFKITVKNKTLLNNLATYLRQTFRRVLPSYAHNDGSSSKYLKYFIMGTYASSKQNIYDALFDKFRNVVILRPKNNDYPLVIFGLNLKYNSISLFGINLDKLGNNGSSLLIKIRQVNKKQYSLACGKLKLDVAAYFVPKEQLIKIQQSPTEWIKVKKTGIVSELLNISKMNDEEACNKMAGVILNASTALMTNPSTSFRPFMHGLFYHAQFLTGSEVKMFLYLSRYTVLVTVVNGNILKNFYVHFWPTLDAAIVSLCNMDEYSRNNGSHVSFMYNPSAESIQMNYYKRNKQKSVVQLMADTICNTFPSIEEQYCNFSSNSNSLLSGLLPQSLSLVPTALIRHAELLSKLEEQEIARQDSEKSGHYNPTRRFTRELAIVKKYKQVKKITQPYKDVYDIYSFGKSIVNLFKSVGNTIKDPSTESIAKLVKDTTSVINKVFKMGVKVLKFFNVIQKGVWFLGPVGTALGAISTACSIGYTLYDLRQQLNTLGAVIQLTTWEILVEGVRVVAGQGISDATKVKYAKAVDLNNNYDRVLKLITGDWFAFQYRAYIASNTCEMNQVCSESAVLLNKEQYARYIDTRYKNIGRQNEKMLCADSVNTTVHSKLDSTHSYYCSKAFAVINEDISNTPSKALYDLGPAASAKALIRYSNHFRIAHNFTYLEGGNENDFFDFTSTQQCGKISGGNGTNTILLKHPVSDDYELIIRNYSVVYKHKKKEEVKDCVIMNNIQRIIGQPNLTETVFVHCTFDMISLRGGKLDRPDRILIPRYTVCVNTISMILSGATEVENAALLGNFIYKVSNLDSGNITLYLVGGGDLAISHTIIVDCTPLIELARIDYNDSNNINTTITITSKSGYTFTLIYDRRWNPIKIVFFNGEQAEFAPGIMRIIVNTEGYSLGYLMDKYSKVRFPPSIAIVMGSRQLGMAIELKNGTIRYNDEEPVPLHLTHIWLNGDTTTIKCSTDQTYVVVLLEEGSHSYDDWQQWHEITYVTFVADAVSNFTGKQDRLRVDFTKFLDSIDLNESEIDFSIEIAEFENSDTFKVVGIASNMDRENFIVCVLYFEGFQKLEWLENIRFLSRTIEIIRFQGTHPKYVPQYDHHSPLKSGDDNSLFRYKHPKLDLIKVPKMIYHHPDYFFRIRSQDVHAQEEITFPNVNMVNFDVVDVNPSCVITSVRSNYDKFILNSTASFFTIILEDFYSINKMRKLLLKFGNGVEIWTDDYQVVISNTDFVSKVEKVQRYLMSKEVELIEQNNALPHEWSELIFIRVDEVVNGTKVGQQVIARSQVDEKEN